MKPGISLVFANLALGDHQAQMMGGRGQEVDGGAVTATGAAYGLAVHGQADEVWGWHGWGKGVGGQGAQVAADGVVQGIRVQLSQHPADGAGHRQQWLAGPATGGYAQVGEGGSIPAVGLADDLGQGGGTAQHRDDAQGQDHAQRVAAALATPGILNVVEDLDQGGQGG
jgi:hypothetical protein